MRMSAESAVRHEIDLKNREKWGARQVCYTRQLTCIKIL
jgi:hypothetical protein